MSRDLVEHGLGWRWTPQRIVRCIRAPGINVAVIGNSGALAGFAIMQYYENEAHLLLLAVGEPHRRRGVGSALVGWLESTVLTAGIGAIFLDARAQNDAARAFYRKLGYSEIRVNRGFYRGHEDGVRIAKDLWSQHA
jgi:ribosomal-protein-alanine N-acetyltransferase